MVKQVENLVKQQYVSSKSNHVICLNSSYLTAEKKFFIGVDLATRVVVGHLYTEEAIDVNMVLDFLETVLEACKFANPVEVIYTDTQSIFKNDRFIKFLEDRNVTASRGSSKAHNNQVVERLHKTIKTKLRGLLKNDFLVAGKKFAEKKFPYHLFSGKVLNKNINEFVELYNNSPHSFNSGVSRNGINECFFNHKEKGRLSNSKALVLVKNEKTPFSFKVIKIRKKVAVSYANNWEKFFLDWRSQEALKSKKLITQNLKLKAKLTEMNKTIKYVAQQTKIQADNTEKKALAKQKRELSAKLPLRDTISTGDFDVVISKIKGHRFSKARRRIALVLLYLFRLRVSNLRLLTVKNVKTLLKTGDVVIPLIKTGANRHPINLSVKGVSLLREFTKDFNVMCENKSKLDGKNPFYTKNLLMQEA